MTHLLQLKSAQTLSDLAYILGVKPKVLSYVLYKVPDASKYHQFHIDKKTGGKRLITAPNKSLLAIQRSLAHVLQNCYLEISNSAKLKRVPAHGFVPHRSILTNAKAHRNKRQVINVDLENFFGSINFGRVYGYFLKNKNFQLKPKVAATIAKIACVNNCLPQGGACSPIISNLILEPLDVRISSLAKECKLEYTRYADDITFSSNNSEVDSRILTEVFHKQWVVSDRLRSIIGRSGFSINDTKTRVQLESSRQDVTGLVVNKRVSVPREFRQLTRSMAHKLFLDGHFTFGKDFDGNDLLGDINTLRGRFSFVDSVDKYVMEDLGSISSAAVHSKLLASRKTSRYVLYHDFLFFINFYFQKFPKIICEGKTDNVYLQQALKKNYSKHIGLVRRSSHSRIDFMISFFNYSKTTRRVMNLNGGVGDIKNLIKDYQSRYKKFKAPRVKQPVIIILDNDKAGREAIKVVNSLIKSKYDPVKAPKDFYPVFENLYIVFVPSSKGDSDIEDLFDKKTLATVHKGKSFNKDPNADKSKYYSKQVFAEQVVRRQSDTIDFDGFDPLLNNILKAIKHYRKHSK